MKRSLNFGEIDINGTGKKENRVIVHIEYTEGEKKRFSVSADVWNRRRTDLIMGGQCLGSIAPYINDPVFNEILRLWRLYHLNDMHPECEHQAAEGWGQKATEKVTLYHWRMTQDATREQKAAEKAAIFALKRGEMFKPTIKQRFFANLECSLTTYTEMPPADIAKYYEPKKPLFAGDKGHTETKALGWLRETEHPEGLLSKACPVCGYKYGHGWNYFPIPEEDEKIIYSILKTGHIKEA